MIYLSIAEDKNMMKRIYLNKGDKLYCTYELNLQQIPVYVELAMNAILSFNDPLAITHWYEPEHEQMPIGSRHAVGINDALNEIYTQKYSREYKATNNKMIEKGMRSQVFSTYVLQISKLFLENPAATLELQRPK